MFVRKKQRGHFIKTMWCCAEEEDKMPKEEVIILRLRGRDEKKLKQKTL